jgi:hypothetical protein
LANANDSRTWQGDRLDGHRRRPARRPAQARTRGRPDPDSDPEPPPDPAVEAGERVSKRERPHPTLVITLGIETEPRVEWNGIERNADAVRLLVWIRQSRALETIDEFLDYVADRLAGEEDSA